MGWLKDLVKLAPILLSVLSIGKLWLQYKLAKLKGLEKDHEERIKLREKMVQQTRRSDEMAASADFATQRLQSFSERKRRLLQEDLYNNHD